MARARNIKPGFFENEILAELDPHARLLFIGLWLLCDKDGRMEYRPKRIGAKLFPYEQLKVTELHDQLCSAGFVTIYTVEGTDYLQVNEFVKHQNPHPKEKAGECPPPPEAAPHGEPRKETEKPRLSTASSGNAGTSRAESLNPESLNPEPLTTAPSSGKPDSTLNEQRQPELVSDPAAVIQIQAVKGEQVPITQSQVDEWSEAYPAIDVLDEIRRARVWLDANPKNRKTKTGMTRFLVNWLSRAQDKAPRAPNGGSHGGAQARFAIPSEPRISEADRTRDAIARQRAAEGSG